MKIPLHDRGMYLVGCKVGGLEMFCTSIPKGSLGRSRCNFSCNSNFPLWNLFKRKLKKENIGKERKPSCLELVFRDFFIFLFQNKLLLHACFNIFIMVSNICAHHVHGFLIYNHLHNGCMASTCNIAGSMSVHISKNCLLIFKLVKSPELAEYWFWVCACHTFQFGCCIIWERGGVHTQSNFYGATWVY